MNENSGATHSHEAKQDHASGVNTESSVGWLEGILGLIESRAGIISWEAKEAFGIGFTKLIPFLFGLFAAFSAWVLIVVAIIGFLIDATEWKWYQITFAMSGLHIIIAVAAFLIAKKKNSTLFPITRSEFEKDRKWLIRLKNQNN